MVTYTNAGRVLTHSQTCSWAVLPGNRPADLLRSTGGLTGFVSDPTGITPVSYEELRAYDGGHGKIFVSSDGNTSAGSGYTGSGVRLKYITSTGGVDGAVWNECTLPASMSAVYSSSVKPVWDTAHLRYVGLVTNTNQMLQSADGVTWVDAPSLPGGVTTDMRNGAVPGVLP